MTRPRINPRLAKRHRTYSVDEAARLFGVHRQTVRNWLKAGLPSIDDKRPLLIRGDALGDFLANRREARRIKCAPGTIYCAPCRAARRPDGGIADCIPCGGETGDLRGLCPTCGRLMHRRVSMARLALAIGDLEVTVAEAPLHLGESLSPSVNCHFNREPEDRE